MYSWELTLDEMEKEEGVPKTEALIPSVKSKVLTVLKLSESIDLESGTS